MHSFSIDYLTRKEVNSDDGNGSPTGSPTYSGVSMNSFGECYSPKDSGNNSGNSSDVGPVSTFGSEKPSHSYIALISMAILDSADKQTLLGDIYQYIMDKFPYYNNKGKAWRNSIRHNLSLNECFIKSGRAENGRGNFWSIHPACIDDFAKGDFRRRKARRRARKSGLTDLNISEMPLSYRCNLGYVHMTPSVVPYSPIIQSTPTTFGSYSANSVPSGLYAQSMSSLPASTQSGPDPSYYQPQSHESLHSW